MIEGFIPLFNIAIPESLNITSLSFKEGKVLFTTLEGYVFVDTAIRAKLPYDLTKICINKYILVSSTFRIYELNDSGKIAQVYKFKDPIISLRCYDSIFVGLKGKIVVIKDGFAPRSVLSLDEEFEDFEFHNDTFYVLFRNGIGVFFKDTLRNFINLDLGTLKLIQIYDGKFWILDDDGNIWAFSEKSPPRKILKGLYFHLHGDTLVVLRDEKFGRFINVLRVVHREK